MSAPTRERLAYVQRTYGLSEREYRAMLALHQGCCHVCLRPEVRPGAVGRARELAVDHDHRKRKGEPGYVRGLLCARCNVVLGEVGVGDDAALLRRMAEYLERSKEKR